MTVFLFAILPLFLASTDSSKPINFHLLPGVHEKVYSQIGDINIGAIASTLQNSYSGCSDSIQGLASTLENTEAIAYAVKAVNRDPNLLPNVTLGFAIRGVCPGSPGVALATALSFLPRDKRHDNETVCSDQDTASSNSHWLSHDVIGLVTPGIDGLTAMISSLYSVAHLPMIGAIEVSDALSDKDNHPYFFRIVPPNKYMVRAMLRFMTKYGWSYISILYQEGSYGRVNYETMYKDSSSFGICIATSHMLILSTDYNQVVADLLEYPRARVVVLFVVGSIFREILLAVKHHNASGHFIFMAGDPVMSYYGIKLYGTDDDEALGTFVFEHFFKYNVAFYNYVQEQRVYSTKNPWLKATHEYIQECSFGQKGCDPDGDIFSRYRYRTSKSPNLRIDAVLSFAHAAHNLLSDVCPDARGEEARACITGQLLREYLRNTSFRGNNFQVEFHDNQERVGTYFVAQIVFERYLYPYTGVLKWKHISRRNFAMYNPLKERMRILPTEFITWTHVNTLDRIVPWTENSLPLEIPESVCSRPCVGGEYKIEKELSCCWECRKCRENERLVKGNTSCEACREFTWPDPASSFTTCIDIKPTFPKFDETIPIALTSLSLLLLLVTISVFVCYAIYRNERVIKASSRELSVIQLVGIFLGYTTIILFQTTPTDTMCGVILVTFCTSFAFLYCPLLVKTIRIVRIFRSGAKNEQPRFISPLSQLIFTICLITVQICLCAFTYILFWPRARLTQPIWGEKMVELSCDLTLPGIASFLGYNLVLVLLCSVFAFMVRKLPDNFNESKFISMCVSTALLIWLAFIPTYFTADKEFIRAFLLSMALLLNHSVALVLLFIPRIYAVIYISQEEGNFSNKRS